jgi:hypothetical protein
MCRGRIGKALRERPLLLPLLAALIATLLAILAMIDAFP